MDAQPAVRPTIRSRRSRQPGLSYKFQRLRERIRDAVASGELHGKLPGERLLAKRFRVNAKTLSKALTDLAGEGLLQRSVGRGTYVAGQMPPETTETRWLILADSVASAGPLVTELLKLNPDSRCITPDEALRPSMLAQFAAVINCSERPPETLYHDLMVRGVPLIETVRPSGEYSTHGIMLDRTQGAFNLGRELLLAGHTRLAAIDVRNSTTVFDALNWAIARYGDGASVRAIAVDHIGDAVAQGVTALVCDGSSVAAQARLLVEQARPMLSFHEEVAIAAVGALTETIPCNGYYLDASRHAAAIGEVLRALQPHRLSVVWLTGTYLDRGTLHAPANLIREPASTFSLSLSGRGSN
jgi:Bacterial regulatory proteins, gntR family